jgi:hypothetical protein
MEAKFILLIATGEGFLQPKNSAVQRVMEN